MAASPPIPAGHVTASPSYLQILLREQRSRRLLAKTDVVVLGPSRSFAINLTARSAPVGPSSDVSFHVTLLDCLNARNVFLTTVAQRIVAPPPIAASSSASASERRRRVRMPYAELSSTGASPYLVLLLVTITMGTVYLLLLVLFGLLRFCKRAHTSNSRVVRLQQLVRAHLTRQRRARLSLKRKALLVSYLCFRAFYNFLFTFSVIVSLILSLESASVLRLQAIASSQKALLDDFRIHFDRLESFGTSELQRQLEQALRMHRACDLSVGATLGNLTQSYEADLGQMLNNFYASSVSLANQTQRVINWKYTAFRHRLERFVDNHKLKMSEAIKVQYAPYGSLLRKAYHTPWLNLPLRLFNGTKKQFVDSLFDYALRPSNLQQPHVDFMSFMYIHEAEALHLLPTKLWKR